MKAHIAELNLHVEALAVEYKQKVISVLDIILEKLHLCDISFQL
jgi:hypothetical protein